MTATRSSVFSGGGSAHTLALIAATPPCAKSLRHRRTASSRTQNTSDIAGLVQPASFSRMARAVSLASISRRGMSLQVLPLLSVRHQSRFARHACKRRPICESVQRRNHRRDSLVKFMKW